MLQAQGLKPDAFKLWVQLDSSCTAPTAAPAVVPPGEDGERGEARAARLVRAVVHPRPGLGLARLTTLFLLFCVQNTSIFL